LQNDKIIYNSAHVMFHTTAKSKFLCRKKKTKTKGSRSNYSLGKKKLTALFLSSKRIQNLSSLYRLTAAQSKFSFLFVLRFVYKQLISNKKLG
jgi:hypothetical protein